MPDPRFPPEKLSKYPHMFPLDIAIWERFIVEHGSEFEGFDYDIKVGTGSEVPPGSPESFARMVQILSKYRIDVVGYTGSEIVIIEVKPEASTVALGQIDAYVTLYKRDFQPQLPVIGAIVSDKEVLDMTYLTELRDIRYYIV